MQGDSKFNVQTFKGGRKQKTKSHKKVQLNTPICKAKELKKKKCRNGILIIWGKTLHLEIPYTGEHMYKLTLANTLETQNAKQKQFSNISCLCM